MVDAKKSFLSQQHKCKYVEFSGAPCSKNVFHNTVIVGLTSSPSLFAATPQFPVMLLSNKSHKSHSNTEKNTQGLLNVPGAVTRSFGQMRLMRLNFKATVALRGFGVKLNMNILESTTFKYGGESVMPPAFPSQGLMEL